jgi:hypothetical protein
MTALTEDERDWASETPWSGEELEAARKISVSLKQDLNSGRPLNIANYEQWAVQMVTNDRGYESASRLRVLRRAEGLAQGWIKDGVD